MAGLYIHIPFCRQACRYCDFFFSVSLRYLDSFVDRLVEEIMTEGTMLLSGVDLDIRFGEPIKIDECLSCRSFERGIASKHRLQFDDPLPLQRLMHKEALKIMQRYMAAIYSMTSVNHDHLFALRGQSSPQIGRGRCFANATFSRCNRDNHCAHS